MWSNMTNSIEKAVSTALSYIQKNASFEIQKAFSIVIMSTAATTWGFKLSEVVDKASDETGYSSKTVSSPHLHVTYVTICGML